ncbi:hypothetical protein CP532_0053 [Ophiocordyceps camponoti-leonardi (nom. inval.)]|nr:hypothetical protein CP532_0053 [Ophiocordyceps camponoti-leonardi (nom. inval.)]
MPGRKALIASEAPMALSSVNNGATAGSESWTSAQLAWTQDVQRRLTALEKSRAAVAAATASAIAVDDDDDDDDAFQPRAKPKRRAGNSLKRRR